VAPPWETIGSTGSSAATLNARVSDNENASPEQKGLFFIFLDDSKYRAKP